MSSKQQRSGPSGPKGSQKYTFLFDAGTVSTVTVSKTTVAVSGVRTTDVVRCINANMKTGLMLGQGRVVSAGVVEIAISNPTAASITTGTVTYTLEMGFYQI